ncbi:MAG: FliM/FliN family flagellar motor switch protein [Puniceicoccales bacterium]|jgi:type III secretion system YscQ/HrcQ family protein|nr:FliM/FliN family flagellar motor switch protein [Puniceicoccales bacterium]
MDAEKAKESKTAAAEQGGAEDPAAGAVAPGAGKKAAGGAGDGAAAAAAAGGEKLAAADAMAGGDPEAAEDSEAAGEGEGAPANAEGVDGEPELVPEALVAAEAAAIAREVAEKAEEEWPLHEKVAATVKEVKFAETVRKKAAGIDLATVEVSLTFDLGTARLSLETLESLREGYTFTLGESSGEFVTIRANGQPIGRGCLVSVDGHLGIQIDELNS